MFLISKTRLHIDDTGGVKVKNLNLLLLQSIKHPFNPLHTSYKERLFIEKIHTVMDASVLFASKTG